MYELETRPSGLLTVLAQKSWQAISINANNERDSECTSWDDECAEEHFRYVSLGKPSVKELKKDSLQEDMNEYWIEK